MSADATKPEDVVTLKEAARLAKIQVDKDAVDPPAEATLHLEAMLGASRRGKVVR